MSVVNVAFFGNCRLSSSSCREQTGADDGDNENNDRRGEPSHFH